MTLSQCGLLATHVDRLQWLEDVSLRHRNHMYPDEFFSGRE
jgi:hypothetical protein